MSFAYPIRPWNYAKVDSEFLGSAYYSAYKKWHRGLDINGIGGGDTDLGYPVQSMFPGEVVDINTTTGYGQCVLVRSTPETIASVRSALGEQVETVDVLYAHLHQVTVQQGDRLEPGMHLGSIGKTGGNYPAHLHLEIRCKPEPTIVSQGGTDKHRAHVEATCLDPRQVMASLRFSDFGSRPEPTPPPEPAPRFETLLRWKNLAVVLFRDPPL